MNTKLLLFALIGLLVSFASCNKSEEPAPSIPQIKTIYTFQNNKLINRQTLERDLLGRLVKITLKSGAYTSYTYSGNNILKMEFDAQSSLTNCDTLILNSQGLVVTAEHGSKIYTYNVDNRLSSEITPDLRLFYSIEDGNTVSEDYLYPNNNATVRMNWFLANSVNTIGNENMGIFFYGKQDKQLLERKVFINQKSWIYQYTYDDKKRVYRCSRTDGTTEVYSTYLYEE